MTTIDEALTIAIEHHQAGRLPAAEQIYRQVLATDPNQPNALERLGVLAHQVGRHDLAVEYITKAIQSYGAEAAFHNNLGEAYRALQKFPEAMACYRQALQLQPDGAEAHNNLGLVLAVQRQFDEATACFQRAVQLKPEFAEAHNNMGAVLQDQKRASAAVAWHQRAVQLKPEFAEAHSNLGNAQRQLGHVAEAVASYQSALQLKPNFVDGHNNLGIALQNQGQVIEAIACYERAMQLKPDHADAHWNRSFAWLLRGDFSHGWLEYEWRWQRKDFPRRAFHQPLWDGRSLEERTILLHAEQGLGDSIQFLRYAPLVQQRGARVVVECQERLLPLFAGCPGIDALVAGGRELPPFDVHAPLLSLPGLFKTTLEDIPASIPYVFATPELIEKWRDKLGTTEGVRIGIAWQGNPTYHSDRCRSIPLARFAPLAQIPSVRLISLQKGPGVEQLAEACDLFGVVDYSSELDEQAGPFMDTAALMMNLDLVITSDSVTAHLAGALGVPVWVALPIAPDWRWLLDRDDSPWYPTMRLFRQARFGDWDDVFSRIATELAAVARGDKSRLSPCRRIEGTLVCAPMAPGELLDKIAILEIKRARISDADKLQNVRIELEQLCAVRDRTIRPSVDLAALSSRLAAVNEKLWEIEDGIRGCEASQDFGPRFVALARAVYITNDERVAIKRQINEILGSRLKEEKGYTPYRQPG